MSCEHAHVWCLNQFELIRKYRCDSCNEVMMCACDEDFARRFHPHQLGVARPLKTQERVPVTAGFQPRICNSCRGLPEEPHPKAEIHGHCSKVRRYYWREIVFETTRRFDAWAEEHGHGGYREARRSQGDEFKRIERGVIDDLKRQHEENPRYAYVEQSQTDVIEACDVTVIDLDATYVTGGNGRAKLLSPSGNKVTAEAFATRYFEGQGYVVLETESRPFHVLFGVFMWLVIQDPADPRRQLVSFGDRFAYEAGTDGKAIWTFLPDDFGSPGYAVRRSNAIAEHFAHLTDLAWLFDYWLEYSHDLRQYLWAHRPQDVSRARDVLAVLPPAAIRRILRYLVGDYWRRYCGWPDLLVQRGREFFFAEVKSSGDRLREDQKNWILGNAEHLLLPYRLVKLHRAGVASAWGPQQDERL